MATSSGTTIPFARVPAASGRRASWYGRTCDYKDEKSCEAAKCKWASGEKRQYCTSKGAEDVNLPSILSFLREEKEGKIDPANLRARAEALGVPLSLQGTAWKAQERKVGGKTAGQLQYLTRLVDLLNPMERKALLERLEQRATSGILPSGYTGSGASLPPRIVSKYDDYYDDEYDGDEYDGGYYHDYGHHHRGKYHSRW